MKNEDESCEILFEYLRSILYDKVIQKLELETLEEPYRKLGMGLSVLAQYVEQLQTYSEELSRGNLSVVCPAKDNLLCTNLKNLHANLNHLTWQAKQVAEGDYSQHVSYLGEFSEAFNTMTEQLRERELLLIEEAERKKNEAMQMKDKAYRDMLTGIGNRLYFEQCMEKIIEKKGTLTLSYMDLDHLKYVNDHFGHIEGDTYIRGFVRNIRDVINEEAYFVRIGGDEFCIVQEGKLRDRIEEKLSLALRTFEEENRTKYPAGFSYGVLEIDLEKENLSVNQILMQADAIMYQQKKMHKEQSKQYLKQAQESW